MRVTVGPMCVEFRGDGLLEGLAHWADAVTQAEPDLVVELHAAPDFVGSPHIGRDVVEARSCRVEFDGPVLVATCRPTPFVLERAVRIATQRSLLERGWLTLHAGSFVIGGRASVLLAPSGTGKSTTVRRLAATGARVLGDEVALVGRIGGAWYVGVHPGQAQGCADPTPAPLEALHRLVRGAPARHPMAPARAAAELLRHAMVYDDDPAALARASAIALDLASGMPSYETAVALGSGGLGALAPQAREAA